MPSLAVPQLAPCASSARACRLWAARYSQGRGPATGRLATASGAQASCLQRALADVTGSDHQGAGGVGFEDVAFSVALNTVDFVGNENVTFRYYDHLLASISPQGGHLQGGTSAVLYGDRFALLVAERPEMSSFVRCRFGARDPIPLHHRCITVTVPLHYRRCARPDPRHD